VCFWVSVEDGVIAHRSMSGGFIKFVILCLIVGYELVVIYVNISRDKQLSLVDT
jgi:hypothetical protein